MMFHSLDKIRKQYRETSYTIFRVLIGVLFMCHGAQKLFGVFTDRAPAAIMSKMWFAGVIEFAGGIMIALGLVTTIIAAICAIEMLYAYFSAHFGVDKLVPIVNGGELALVYFAAFLYITMRGPGKHSLDAACCKECKK